MSYFKTILAALLTLWGAVATASIHGSAPQLPISGPLTAAGTPFAIVTPSGASVPAFGTISPRASGSYQKSDGTTQNCGTPTAFNLNPASGPTVAQYLIGATSGCAFTVASVSGLPVNTDSVTGFCGVTYAAALLNAPANAIALLCYPPLQPSRTDTIAIGDGTTVTFAASYNPTGGVLTNGSPAFTGLSSTDGILPGMAIYPTWADASTGAGSAAFPFGTTVTCLGNPCGTNPTTSLTMSANSICTACTGKVPNFTGYTPGGTSYPFLYMTPVPGTITVSAGAVSGVDGGTVLNTGFVNISGTGVSGTIKLIKDGGYKDLIFNTHQGYYSFTFSSPPANGMPITLTYQYGYLPTGSGSGTSSIVSTTNTVSMWRLLPSVDDAIARARAVAFATGSLPGSGIAVLDRSVGYGIQAGQSTVLPCLDMTVNCNDSNTNSGTPAAGAGNKNPAVGPSTCPEWTSGNTWTWAAATATFRPTASGSSGNVKIYCGVNAPGTIFVSGTSFISVKNNKVVYGNVASGPLGIQVQSSNVTVEYNDVSSNPATFQYQFVTANACASVIGTAGQVTGNVVQNNYFHDCDGDAFDAGNSDGLVISQNRFSGLSGFSFGSHADGFQTTGLNTLATNISINGNFIQNFDLGGAQSYLNFVHGYTGSSNAIVYIEAFSNVPPTGGTATSSAAINNNFLDGGVRGIQITPTGNGTSTATASFTNNLQGNNQNNGPSATVTAPSPQTGNYNVYSGAIWNPY